MVRAGRVAAGERPDAAGPVAAGCVAAAAGEEVGQPTQPAGAVAGCVSAGCVAAGVALATRSHPATWYGPIHSANAMFRVAAARIRTGATPTASRRAHRRSRSALIPAASRAPELTKSTNPITVLNRAIDRSWV